MKDRELTLQDVLLSLPSFSPKELIKIRTAAKAERRYKLGKGKNRHNAKAIKEPSGNCKGIIKFREDLIVNATKAELKVKELLDSQKIEYEFQKIVRTPRGFIVDFYLPREDKRALIVEIDGGYHNHHKQQIKDAKRQEKIEAKIGIVMRFTNEEVFANPAHVLSAIRLRL